MESRERQESVALEEEDIIAWDFENPSEEDKALLEKMSNRTETGGGAADPAAIGHHGHTELFKDLIHAIQTDGKPLIDGHEGKRSVEIIVAIYEAARTGQRVTLEK